MLRASRGELSLAVFHNAVFGRRASFKTQFSDGLLDSTQRGPCGSFIARTPEKTVELYQKLQKENVIVSLREGRIRVSPHLFNSERDINRLVSVVSA